MWEEGSFGKDKQRPASKGKGVKQKRHQASGKKTHFQPQLVFAQISFRILGDGHSFLEMQFFAHTGPASAPVLVPGSGSRISWMRELAPCDVLVQDAVLGAVGPSYMVLLIPKPSTQAALRRFFFWRVRAPSLAKWQRVPWFEAPCRCYDSGREGAFCGWFQGKCKRNTHFWESPPLSFGTQTHWLSVLDNPLPSNH